MKPLRLLLQAFGPYISPVAIDFTPFDSTGIFLITGPTGGGKTSLLDAMSFALFCKATGGHREFSDMRCMRAPQDLPTLVELDFSLNGKSYRFRRSQFYKVNRRTKKAELCESHECFRLEDEPVLLEHGSASSVTRQAEALLHLNYRQFAQVIVLPQGDFLRLLRANSKEKGDILRTLFSAQVWEQLRERFHQREKALELEIRDAANMRDTLLRQAGAGTAQELESAVKAGNEEIQQLAKNQEETAKALSAADALVKSAAEWSRLTKSLSAAQLRLNQAEERIARAEKEAPQAEEKRNRAEALQKEAVAAAQDQERLTGQLAALNSARETERKARQALDSQAAKQKELDALRERQSKLAERIENGSAYEKQCQAENLRLPGLLEKRQLLEKRLALLEELENRRKEEKSAEKALEAARLDADSLSLRLASQEELRRRNAALDLAGALREGEPCPVCGAVHHPSPACLAGEGLLPPQALDALRTREKEARNRLAGAAAQAAARREELLRTEARLAELPPAENKEESIETVEKAWQEAKAQAESARKLAGSLTKAQEKLAALAKEKESAAAQETALRTEISGLEAQARELERSAKEARDALENKEPQALQEAIGERGEKCRSCTQLAARLRAEAEASLQELARAREALALAKETAEKAGKELEKVQAEWPQPPDLEALQATAEELREKGLLLSRQLGEAQSTLRSQTAALGSVREQNRKLEELDQRYGRTARLSRGLSGGNPYSTPVLQYALSITLDEVLVSANQFFARLSRGRYALRRVAGPRSGRGLGGLDIEVQDGASMLPRSIETLSGGEQFMASLSLAFGLSDVVQSHSGAVGLDSIFIDEGFGSLDEESLDQVMQALALLRTGGRMIGIISHVQELQGRIGSRIQVFQDAQGAAQAQAVVC